MILSTYQLVDKMFLTIKPTKSPHTYLLTDRLKRSVPGSFGRHISRYLDSFVYLGTIQNFIVWVDIWITAKYTSWSKLGTIPNYVYLVVLWLVSLIVRNILSTSKHKTNDYSYLIRSSQLKAYQIPTNYLSIQLT